MGDVVLMHVEDTTHDLLHDDGSDLLGEGAGVHDLVEKFATGANLHDEVDLLGIFEGLVELHEVGMIEHLHDGDFLLESRHVLNLSLRDHLARADLAGLLVLATRHAAVTTLTKLGGSRFIDFVNLADLLRRLRDQQITGGICLTGCGF